MSSVVRGTGCLGTENGRSVNSPRDLIFPIVLSHSQSIPMMSSFDPHRARYLSGTVTIPSPFPEVGQLSLQRLSSTAPRKRRTVHIDFLCIEHTQSHGVMIARFVSLDDVTAVLLVENGKVKQNDGHWLVGAAGQHELLARLRKSKTRPVEGIAYVREHAQVLMRVETGMTAVESSEYYPPTVSERTDSHYQLQRSPLWGSSCEC